MLADEKSFKEFEKILIQQGVIKGFERQNGRVTGYMMITAAAPPDDVEIEITEGDAAFLATFSFCDTAVGAVINPVTKELNGDVWLEKQRDNAKKPARKWIEFFIKTLVGGIGSDGSYGCPMYTFISERSSFTIAPAKQ